MSQFKYGLNIPQKTKKSLQKPAPNKARALFDDNESDEEEKPARGPESIVTLDQPLLGVSESKNKSNKAKSLEKHSRVDTRYGDLSARRDATKQAESAQEVDSSVYDYDAVYDKIHAKPTKKKEVAGPKYMQQLLEAAEIRKRDQLRAKEKMLAKEREAEGDEFADKEKFVTAAYRAQQEELKRLEEAEREREEEAAERRKREGGGMRGLYKDMLDREDARQEAIAEALNNDLGETELEENVPKKHDYAQHKEVTLNDEGEIVDKRQLLVAGINLSAKPKATPQTGKKQMNDPSVNIYLSRGRGEARAAMRERQSQLIEQQLAQTAKRAADDKAAEEEAIQKAAKSQKSQADISSARERYLQRKRDREAETAKKEGS